MQRLDRIPARILRPALARFQGHDGKSAASAVAGALAAMAGRSCLTIQERIAPVTAASSPSTLDLPAICIRTCSAELRLYLRGRALAALLSGLRERAGGVQAAPGLQNLRDFVPGIGPFRPSPRPCAETVKAVAPETPGNISS